MRNSLLLILAWFLLGSFTTFAQRVSGVVTSGRDNSPLPGVSVLVKGTSTGVATDIDGKYALEVSDPQNAVLVFSFIGFNTEEVSVGGRTKIDVTLVENLQQISEVVVTSLGIKREQKALGYAVSTISSEQINSAGNTNFASALYGKAPGVRISTAPGGATSAVNVQIRGINSLNFNNQPLYVVDGIMIRDNNQAGGNGINNGGYWDDQKIRGNGILDINPADIESLTVLKGAAASALYGSEAANGVIVITTKRGTKRTGLGVDLNYVYNVEEVGVIPDFQNVYGPGYDRETNLANGATEEGWIPVDLDGDGIKESNRPYFRAYGQFGPKMEGQRVPWWDGQMRSYSAQPDNYRDFYQKGYNSSLNLAVSNQTDKATYRLSYTRMDYEGIQRNSKLERNTFNLNSTIKLSDKLSTDIIVNYVNSKVHNRPEQINRITANYGGFFSRIDDMGVYLDKYKTSEGYKYVPYDQAQKNPDEAIKYNIRAYDLLDFLWKQLRNSEVENQDRLISSLTLNYDVVKNLKFRGRIGTDFTSLNTETKQHNEYPLSFNGTNSTGYYGLSNGRYSILYTDELLTYSNKINEFSFSLSGGIQARKEIHRNQSANTEGGLVVENWFNLANSKNLPSNPANQNWRKELLKYAFLGIANFGYKDVIFVEGTARKEYSSTLPPGNNNYTYGGANASFVLTEAFQLPTLFSYAKLRAAYGVVGNAPPIYASNIAYDQKVLQVSGAVPSLSAQNKYGNINISPEKKYEMEFGLDTRIIQNRIGLDLTYYNNKTIDQIINMQLPTSTGAREILANLGELRSYGWEVGLNATPVKGALTWDVRLSAAFNRTRVEKLMEGLDKMIYYSGDGNAVQIAAEKGKPLGDIYVHPRETDDNGNFIVDDGGYYIMSQDYVKVGNILPKSIGGLANTFTYKGVALNVLLDYRFGGKLVSPPILYGKGAGLYKETLQYRDEANGGLPYYIAGDKKIQLESHSASAPDNSKVYHDGILLKGVTADGSENKTILDAPSYYLNTYGWSSGWYEDGAVFNNSYIKVREVTLSYSIPKEISSKLKLQNVQVSLIGRNLFYVWKTLPHLDPEVAIGSAWNRQGVDEGSMAPTRSYGFSINAKF